MKLFILISLLLVSGVLSILEEKEKVEEIEEEEEETQLYSKQTMSSPSEWLKENKNVKILWTSSQTSKVLHLCDLQSQCFSIFVLQKRRMSIEWMKDVDVNLTVPLSLLWRHCYVLHPNGFG